MAETYGRLWTSRAVKRRISGKNVNPGGLLRTAAEGVLAETESPCIELHGISYSLKIGLDQSKSAIFCLTPTLDTSDNPALFDG